MADITRRDLIAKSAGLIAIACVEGRAIAGNPFTREPLCAREFCQLFLDATARQLMDETGEWKQDLIRTRTCPLVFTFYGCCGCEISLPKGTEHPDWNYVRRNLTSSERASFRDEYGRQAEFLLHLEISKNLNIRGFVLNGRKLGWNLSVGHA